MKKKKTLPKNVRFLRVPKPLIIIRNRALTKKNQMKDVIEKMKRKKQIKQRNEKTNCTTCKNEKTTCCSVFSFLVIHIINRHLFCCVHTITPWYRLLMHVTVLGHQKKSLKFRNELKLKFYPPYTSSRRIGRASANSHL